MKIIAVDDELIALKNLEFYMNKIDIKKFVHYETSPIKALEWLKLNPVDVALLDIDMRQMNGLALAKKIKEIYPNCFIIFITGYSQYAVEAFTIKATGYLVKPFTLDDLKSELYYIGEFEHQRQTRIYFQCFGNFEVFADYEPISFKYTKTKELLAYLIDRRGASISSGELIGILWEDKIVTTSLKTQLRNLTSDLIHTLKFYNSEKIIKKINRNLAINTDIVECDYYSFNKKEIWAINSYHGEYMNQYSWAEMTIGILDTN